MSIFHLEKAKNSEWTLFQQVKDQKKYWHSKYNPSKEAQIWANSRQIDTAFPVIIYGIGLGYHVEALLELYPSIQVVAFELSEEPLALAKEHSANSNLLSHPRLLLRIGLTKQQMAAEWMYYLQKLSEFNAEKNFLIYLPALEGIEDPEFKTLLKSTFVYRHSVDNSANRLEENFRTNLPLLANLLSVEALYDKFEDIPLLIIGGGPSIEEIFPCFNEIKKHCIILAVSTVLKPLRERNLIPHLVISVDPNPWHVAYFEGWEDTIPLIAMATVDPDVFKNYRGPILYATAEGITDWHPDLYPMVETGGSVITTALDIGIRMRCDPIVLTGADFCYPSGNSHHPETAFFHRKSSKFPLDVLCNDGSQNPTTTPLYRYRLWMEHRAAREKDRTFFNVATQGAVIKGFPYKPIWDLLTLLPTTSSHENIIFSIFNR